MTTAWNPTTYDRDFAFVAEYGRELLGWLDPQPGERVLDLGCGTGEIAAQIQAAGAEVIAIDSDPHMVEAARERLPDTTVILADGHDFQVDEPVDAVFSNAALHWMPAAVEVLGCVSAALRVGGRFVAEMGAAGNVAAIVDAVDEACASAGLPERRWPWFFPSPAAYAAMLEDADLEVRLLEHYARPTLLNGPDGFRAWLSMFAADATAELPDEVITEAERRARPQLVRDGEWWADYRRLRFRAVRVR